MPHTQRVAVDPDRVCRIVVQEVYFILQMYVYPGFFPFLFFHGLQCCGWVVVFSRCDCLLLFPAAASCDPNAHMKRQMIDESLGWVDT